MPPEETVIAAPDTPSDASSRPKVVFQRADLAGFGRVWGWWVHAAAGLLAIVTLLVALGLLPIAIYTFWVLFETARRVAGGAGAWSTPAALIVGVLTAWGIAYLGMDRIALLGNRSARHTLARKAEALSGAPLPPTRFFVEMKSEGEAPRPFSGADIGWLALYSDRLEFFGDTRHGIVPRACVAALRHTPNLAQIGLGGPWLVLTLDDPARPDARLRFLSRDADRLSDTAETARALESALRAWLRTCATA